MSHRKRTQRNIRSYVTRQQPHNDDEATSSMASPATPASRANPANVSLPPDLENLRSVLTTSMREIVEDLIEKALSSLTKTLGDIKTTVTDHGQRITDMEDGLSEYSERTVALEKLCKQLTVENESLFERMESAENRSRRFNLRCTNIPELAEKDNAIQFMSEFFVEVLGDTVYQSAPVLDLAHRIGRERSGPPGKPRVMIVRFHYFQDKARALKADRNQLNWRGRKVLFYPDYAAATAKLRASFSRVKSLLYAKKVQFRLVFPAVLKVDFKNRTYVFKTAADAMQFYNQRIAGFAGPGGDDGAVGSDGDGGTAGPEGGGGAARSDDVDGAAGLDGGDGVAELHGGGGGSGREGSAVDSNGGVGTADPDKDVSTRPNEGNDTE